MSSEIFERLAAPFPADVISWRIGSMTKDKTKARALAYIDARDVMRRLDEVCGPGRWQCRYVPMPNGTTCCEIGLHYELEWIWKANGAGATDIEGEKGGYSDAFKRAAVLWGVGQYLYDIDSPWVRINEYKQIEKDELPKLRALLNGVTPKSAYQAHKDDDWKKLAADLKECQTLEQISAFLEGKADMIAAMPKGWQKNWDELVSSTRDAARGRMAA